MGIKEELEKRGIKSAAMEARALNHVGSTAPGTFADVVKHSKDLLILGNVDWTEIGDVYNNAYYKRAPYTGEKTYEPIYGNVDWTRVAEDDTTLQIIGEAHGDSGHAPAEPITPANLYNVYGREKAIPNKKELKELARASQDAQSTTRQWRDAGTKGIRGVGELDAPIDPYA